METKKDSLLTRLFGRKTEVEEEVVIDEASVPTVAKELPNTLLSLTPEQQERISAEERAELEKKLQTVPPLRIGEINFNPFECGRLNGGYYVRVFIRHGRDLLEDFTMEELTLYLVDATGEKVAGGVFKMGNFGVLKFGEVRPWTFYWGPEQVSNPNANLSYFTLSFIK